MQFFFINKLKELLQTKKSLGDMLPILSQSNTRITKAGGLGNIIKLLKTSNSHSFFVNWPTPLASLKIRLIDTLLALVSRY